MDFKTDPVVSQALQERLAKDVMGYTYTPDEFYDAIVGWEKSQHGFDVPREWVGYCPGVIASICQAYLTFTQPGDKIVVQTPVYDQFFTYAKRLGRQVVENPLIEKDGWYEMDFDGLDRLYDRQVKVLVLCNPHNPVGIIWPKETLERLADWCAAHDVMVFSDEIHADLALYGKKHTPFCHVSPTAARVGLMFCSPTKAFNIPGITGTAYCIIPDEGKRQRFHETLASWERLPSRHWWPPSPPIHTNRSGWRRSKGTLKGISRMWKTVSSSLRLCVAFASSGPRPLSWSGWTVGH